MPTARCPTRSTCRLKSTDILFGDCEEAIPNALASELRADPFDAVKKTRPAPPVHRLVVFEHRVALVGGIADGIVVVSATAPAPVGAEGARRVGNPV